MEHFVNLQTSYVFLSVGKHFYYFFVFLIGFHSFSLSDGILTITFFFPENKPHVSCFFAFFSQILLKYLWSKNRSRTVGLPGEWKNPLSSMSSLMEAERKSEGVLWFLRSGKQTEGGNSTHYPSEERAQRQESFFQPWTSLSPRTRYQLSYSFFLKCAALLWWISYTNKTSKFWLIKTNLLQFFKIKNGCNWFHKLCHLVY